MGLRNSQSGVKLWGGQLGVRFRSMESRQSNEDDDQMSAFLVGVGLSLSSRDSHT